MTNLSSSSIPKRLTRERILIAAPLLLGLISAGVVVVLQLLPIQERIAELDARLQDLRTLQQQGPMLRQRIDVAQNNLKQAQVKQALLLDLVAGRDQIQTFLALLDQRAMTTGVVIQRFEPLQQVSSLGDSQARIRGSSDQSPLKSVDPLEDLGYRRTAVALTVFGSYKQLHYFLKEMEKLEVVVEASDLTLEAASDSGVDDEASSNQQRIELSLRFSFYDRSPVNESGTFSSPESVGEAPN